MLITNIFHSLLKDAEFFSKVFPYIQPEYFVEEKHKVMQRLIHSYVSEHGCHPSVSDVRLMLETDRDIHEDLTEKTSDFLDELSQIKEKPSKDLLFKEAERWAQDRALENAILDSVEILKNDEGRGQINDIVRNALSVSFSVQLGHNYFEDAGKRYESYSEKEEFVATSKPTLNKMLGGGYTKKAIYMWLGRTNIGKTLILCDTVADLLMAGKDVVYFTAEMAESRIAQRIDANLLDINVKELPDVDKKVFFSKLKKLYGKTSGTFYLKEYPTSTANVLHLKAYLDELKLKKNFRPDFVVVDYLNIFTSSRVPASKSMETYGYMKAVTEEFRALCSLPDVGKNGEGIGLITATQTNRGGSTSTAETMDYTDTSESFGVPMTVDWQGGIIQTPELFKQGKYVLKNLKSRFDDNINEIYTIGVDRSRMRLYELPDEEKEIPVHVKDRLRQERRDANEGVNGFDFEDGLE